MNDILRRNWPESYGFSIFGEGPSYVISVEKDSIAHQSGLCPGDQLLELDGFNVSSMSDETIKTLARSKSVSTPTISVISRLKFLKLEADHHWGYGMTLQGVKPTFVATIDPPGPAYLAGVRPNDIILEIDGCKIRSLQLASSILKERYGSIVLAMVALESSKQVKPFSANNSRILKAKLIFLKMNETFKEDLKKKMVLIKLLREFAENRNVETFAKSLKILLNECQGESLIHELRKFIPMNQKERFDEIVIHDRNLKREFQDSEDEATNWRKVMLGKGKEKCGLVLKGRCPVMVESVIRDGPADKVGIRTGDVIMKVNGLDVRNSDCEYVAKLLANSNDVSLQLSDIPSLQIIQDDVISDVASTVSSMSSSSAIKWNCLKNLNKLFTEDEIKNLQRNLKSLKEHGDVNEFVSSTKHLFNTQTKQTVWKHLLQTIREKSSTSSTDHGDDFDLDDDDDDDDDDNDNDASIGSSRSRDLHLFETVSTDSAISTIESAIFSETESGNEAFKRDLDSVMTPSERKYLEKVLKIYQKNKNAANLMEDLCHLLDSSSKQILWKHIVDILPRKHQDYCRRQFQAFTSHRAASNYSNHELPKYQLPEKDIASIKTKTLMVRESSAQTTPIKSPKADDGNSIISPTNTKRTDESFVKSEQSLKNADQNSIQEKRSGTIKSEFSQNVARKTAQLSKTKQDVPLNTEQPAEQESIEPNPPPPPPPPPFLSVANDNQPQSSLKRINWEKLDKVDESSIWAKIKEESEDLEDVVKYLQLEQHFSTKDTSSLLINNPKHLAGILNARKAYNLSILLKQTKLTVETLRQALIEFDETIVTPETLKHLITFSPDSDEMQKYAEFNGLSADLNEADQFALQVCKIPSFKTRLQALLFKVTFLERTSEMKKKLRVLRNAVKELLESKKLANILEVTLALGNYMNRGNQRVGGAPGFRIMFLSQLDATKSNAGTKTFLNSLVEALQSKYPRACYISQDLPSIHEAAKISEDAVSADLNEMSQTIKDFFDASKDFPENVEHSRPFDKFFITSQAFFLEASKELEKLKEERTSFLSDFKQLEQYFGGLLKGTTSHELLKMFSDFVIKFENAIRLNASNRRKQDSK